MKIIFFLILIASYNFINAQVCDDAQEISNLPFNDLSVNTANADCDIVGNYYTISGQAGNDTIYKFHSNDNQNIDIILSDVTIQEWMIGIYLLDTCPDIATNSNYIATATGGNLEIINQSIISNKTYYIVVTNTIVNDVNAFEYNITVRKHYDYDLSVDQYKDPKSYYDLTASLGETSAEITNNGNYPIDTIYFGLELNGSFFYDTIYDANLLVDEQRAFYPFVNDMSVDGSYFTKFFICNNDENANNDTLTKLSHNLYEINTFPHYTDFETNNGGWVTEWAIFSNIQSSWEYGTVNGAIIDTAASGTKAYVTNLNGNCKSNEISFLMSQSYDFTNISVPMIEFDLWKALDNTGTLYLQYIDTTCQHYHSEFWHTVGTVGSGTNWYNEYMGQNDNNWIQNSDGWIKSRHRIPEIAGKPHIILRFVFEANSYTTVEGIGIDNIKIYEAPNHDIGITDIINPKSKCNINNDSIQVVITNFSPDTAHSNFIIKAIIDDTYELTDTVYETVNANDTLVYTFNSTYNFSQFKEYKIKVTTLLNNEDDITNDADSTTFFNYDNFNTYPYTNDFETNNGTWFSSGINSTWEYGTPTDTVITSAASGTKIWATNLSGYHNQPEESYLTSSCFDFTELTKPVIKFKANYSLYVDGALSSTVQLLFSSDYGLNWSILGNSSVNNWYPAGFAWSGNTSNWKEMAYKITEDLNSNNIQFKFKLLAFEDKTGFAFDDFSICDAPTSNYTYIEGGSSVKVNNTSTKANSYQWIINNVIVSTDESPTIELLKDTTNILLVAINDCYTDTITHIIYTTNINKLLRNGIEIYPNPASTYININSKESIIDLIEINDLTGKIIYKSNLKSRYYKINTSKIDKGIYFIKIFIKDKYLLKKIIIE